MTNVSPDRRVNSLIKTNTKINTPTDSTYKMRYFLLYSDILFIGPDLFCIRLPVMYDKILVMINGGIANDMSVSRLPAY